MQSPFGPKVYPKSNHVATIQAPAMSTTRVSSGERGRTIALAIGVHPSFGASKLISASFLRLLERNNGMLQLASHFFLPGRVVREGGVVAVTSRYT